MYYEPNTALINHALSYVKGFSDLGIKAEWVFLVPHTGKKSIPKVNMSFDNISVRYLWKERYARNRVLKNLYLHFSYARFFFFKLKKGDSVLLLGLSQYIFALNKRKGINVYHDRTEHPDVVRISNSRYWRKKYLKELRNITGLFVISNALKNYFASVGVERDKIHVINMVVDSNRFINLKKSDGCEPYVAYCGKASNMKDGVDDLIKAFAIVAKKFLEVKLYIMGEAPSKESDNVALVESLGIKDRVVFTGIIAAEDMPHYLVNAKALCLARPNSLQNKYGFPTKLGEYLLSGNPVVVTKVGDIPLFLNDGDTALMAECGDIEEFANKIKWVLENPEGASIIGARGKKVAEQNFNYLTETKKMVEVIFNK